jgi:penicillin amidase
VPFEELPWSKDPESGVIATANNRIHRDDYPHHLGHDWSSPSRIRRIGELLAVADQHTPDTFAAAQRDVVSIPARELAPVLAIIAPADERQRTAIALLAGWDGDLHPGSAAACLYEAWCHHIAERTLRPALGDRLFAHYYARRQSTSDWKAVVLPALLASPSGRWFRAGGEEARDTLVREALDAALDELAERLGEDPDAWRWGDLHHVRFAHQLAMLPGLGELLTAGEVEVGGDEDTVNVAHTEPDERYGVVVLPSWRMIADLSDPDASVGCHTTGQSGHPASPHWNDLVPLWARADHHPLPFTPEAVAAAAESTMTLVPR